MPVSVFDVADYILNKLGPMTTMKLQKLVYYCQAWSLVWDDDDLFREEIQAWANGPVVPELYQFHKGEFIIDAANPPGDRNSLSPEQIETIDSVLNYYGNKPAKWLIDLTHLEDPWQQAREGLSPFDRGTAKITNSMMAEYYSNL